MNDVHPTVKIGKSVTEVAVVLDDLKQSDVIGRIWQKDYTVWKPEPTDIVNRLGWLTVTDVMAEHLEDIKCFSREIREAGFQHVVLLGMGGSSLGPEVLNHVFGAEVGYPELFVLDSTIPSTVKSVVDSIDPSVTIFIVSSKSGSTLESNLLYKYFKNESSQFA